MIPIKFFYSYIFWVLVLTLGVAAGAGSFFVYLPDIDLGAILKVLACLYFLWWVRMFELSGKDYDRSGMKSIGESVILKFLFLIFVFSFVFFLFR